jgi:hypothetical protein
MWKNAIVTMFFFAFSAVVPLTLFAQQDTGDNASYFLQGQRDLGKIILVDLSIKDGKIAFSAASGGCTEKSYFKVNVQKEKGVSEKIPNYLLTIERIKVDDCKSLLPEGTVIEYDLEKDLGLKGTYTISIANRVYPKTAKFY